MHFNIVATSLPSFPFLVSPPLPSRLLSFPTIFLSSLPPSPSPPAAPIPGGCSLTSPLEIDPQLHTTFSTYSTTLYFQVCLLPLSFPPSLSLPPPQIFPVLSLPLYPSLSPSFPLQDSNRGYSPKSAGPPQCDSPNNPSIQFLKYNTYRKCLGAYNFDVSVLFDAIEDMLTLQLVLRQVHLSCLYVTAWVVLHPLTPSLPPSISLPLFLHLPSSSPFLPSLPPG